MQTLKIIPDDDETIHAAYLQPVAVKEVHLWDYAAVDSCHLMTSICRRLKWTAGTSDHTKILSRIHMGGVSKSKLHTLNKSKPTLGLCMYVCRKQCLCRTLQPSPYVAFGGGGILPPRRTFYAVALKPLRIVTNAFVTFPEYILAKNAEKFFQTSPLVFPIWRLKNGQQTKKSSKILC